MISRATTRCAVLQNPAAIPSRLFGPTAQAVLPDDGFVTAWNDITLWPQYKETPLYALPGLAHAIGVANIWIKDESARFNLKSFKALGGAYAVVRLAQRVIAQAVGIVAAASDVLDGQYRDEVSDLVVTCATDGNHGRAVAWAANCAGCRCVIYVHESVSHARRAAIEMFGADVREVAGTYDDSVRFAAAQASSKGWLLVSDVSSAEDPSIARDIMQGYRVMAEEIVRALPTGEVPSHTFVQVGVGALAGAMCTHFWSRWGSGRPRFVTVEPSNAACLFESLRTRARASASGSLNTVMAGLACGEVSELAWEILREGVDAALTVEDSDALSCMRLLADGTHGDSTITSGESGVAGLAGLVAAAQSPSVARTLRLRADSRVLLFSTEGDTDENLYRKIVTHR